MEMICTPEPPVAPLLGHFGHSDLEDGLRAVVSGDQLAARIPNYYPAELASEMANRLREHKDFNHYTNAPDIGKLGSPFYDTVGDAELELAYWRDAASWNRTVRSVFAPSMSPIDRVHVELDESWPGGLHLLRNSNGEPAFAGLARVFGDGAQALPHVDRLEWDAPPHRVDIVPKKQIAMNVYLEMPRQGGELVIWNYKPNRHEHERLRIPGSYGLDRAKLPEPAHVITPSVGELIVFDAQNVHAVQPSWRTPRVTVSFFIIVSSTREAFMYS